MVFWFRQLRTSGKFSRDYS
ncbi:formin-like protein 5 [Iris pallida]|uniref:Formin-like protein 5 n=1 Tax=Iris pallida TaxID=29817 RepID=A0AAX6EC39_IRIPA|nr:formin-like protein 5 [Iris pallida]